MDEGERKRAAEAFVLKRAGEMGDLIRAAFLAGAEWGAARERGALISDARKRGEVVEPTGSELPAGPHGDVADAPSPLAEQAPVPGASSQAMPRTTTDDVVEVVRGAGKAGIPAAAILEKLRGGAPAGGQRDNTVSKAIRRAKAKEAIKDVNGRYVII